MRATYPVLVILGFVLNYPGRAISDSLRMFNQGRHPTWLDDWHSPLLALLWSLPDPWLGQPAAGLLVQSLAIWVLPAALLAAAWGRLDDGRQPLLAALHLLLCCLLVLLTLYLAGYVFKDVAYLAALMLCIWAGLRLTHGSEAGAAPTAWLILAAAVFAVYLIRPTTIGLLLVVLALWLLRCRPSRWWPLLPRAAAAALALIVLAQLSGFVNHRLLGAKRSPVEISLTTFDVAGISIRSGRNLFEGLPAWPPAMTHPLEHCYTPRWWDPFASWGKCREYAAAMTENSRQLGRGAIVRWWLGHVVQNPVAYLQHRLDFVGHLLVYRGDRDDYFPIDNAPAALEFLQRDRADTFIAWQPSLGFELVHAGWRWMTQRFLGQPWFWLGLAVVGLTLSFRRRTHGDADSLPAYLSFAAAIGNFAMLAVLGVADSPRYMVVTLALSLVGYVLLVRARLAAESG
ncbi:MAG: hypothetical protein H6945_03855 [Zoogloeaceae bacterium]|nr:hypothetical protein [Rhodocyclaceae bacterium]MCP5234858.1 hypothetical protein [Zoogloeaceae bacterium]